MNDRSRRYHHAFTLEGVKGGYEACGGYAVSKPKQLVEDVKFVFVECARLQNLAAQGIDHLPHDDVFFSLPHPSGQGQMLCGKAAQVRLQALAEEAGRRARLLRRVELDTLLDPMEAVLVQRFIREQRPINVQQVDRVLAEAGRAARQRCVSTVHLIPCHLTLTKDPERLTIGPVTFLSRAAFDKRVRREVRAYRSRGDESERVEGRQLARHALRYYRTFNWVAEVLIPDCDASTSETLAEQAVISALDCLHLVLGARWTDRMRVGGPALRLDDRARLSITSGDLGVSLSRQGAGQINFQDGWSEQLAEQDYKAVFDLCGVALESAVDPDVDRPLSRRFLDAAQWFGEASRDDSASTRLVKYATALERMVMTEEKDDITTLMSERVAALCFNSGVPGDRENWRRRARETYDLRSKLVHGSLSPRADEVRQGVAVAAELGSFTLLRALSHFGAAGLRDEAISSRRLGQWFSSLAERADEIAR